METVLIVIHLMIVVAMVATVLLQRSEGGALGIGGGGGGGLMTGRGAANILTRTTAVLAGAFFLTSIALTLVARSGAPTSVFDNAVTTGQDQEKPGEGVPLLKRESAPAAPEAPAAPQPGAPQVPQPK
ncbi:MAG TPA: preprotein translocase subunit SecG [Hyphomicrobiales bacterium]|nr:preprotein translocase subunit SecG [Rhodobiaceae bacterium]HXK54423.1 preprotein translocase subunit SecG [Hyphomicrobiales bacterium]